MLISLGMPLDIPAPNRKPASVAASGRYINVDSSEVFLEPKVVDFILPTVRVRAFLIHSTNGVFFWGGGG